MNCTDCIKLEKKIKVMLSDQEFELRKLSEDKAEQKALFQLNIQKELRKWQQKFNKERSQHEEDNKKWLNKIDQISANCQLAIQQANQICQNTIQQDRSQTKIIYESKVSQITQRYQFQISQLKNSHRKQLAQIQCAHKSKISNIENNYQSQLQKLKFQSSKNEETLKKNYEQQINNLKNENLSLQKQKTKIQDDNRKQRSKYLGEIYDSKVIIATLQQNVKSLKASIVAKQQEIKRQQVEIRQLKEHNLEQKINFQRQQQTAKKEYQECLNQQSKLFYEKELQITNMYEVSVKSIQEKRQYQQRLFQNNLHEIRCCIESRPSRVQDVEEILIIRERLSRKQKDFQLLERQLKNYQLELQNKEDIYNKLFIPSVNSTHLNDSNSIKKKQLRVKRTGKSLSTVRDILGVVNQSNHNYPILASIDKKLLPPKSVKIL